MTKHFSGMWLCLVVLALLSPVRGASAQSADAKREASAHFRRGAELFEEGLYRAALVELKRAYELAPNYRVLMNIGQTHVALGEFVEAIGAFEAYLAEGGSELPAAREDEVRAQIEQLTRRTGAVSVTVEPEGATVSVDGVAVGRAPLTRVPVNVGRRRVSAVDERGATAAEEVDIAGGDFKEISLKLALPQPQVARGEPSMPPPAERRLTRRQRWGIGVLSGGIAMGLAGLGTALMAKSARDDYDAARRRFPGAPADIEDARDKLSTRALVSDVLFGGAAALGVTGVVLLLTKRGAEERPAASAPRFTVGLTPRGIIAEGWF